MAAVGELVIVAVMASAVGVVVCHMPRCSDKKKPTLPSSSTRASASGANCCRQFSTTPKIWIDGDFCGTGGINGRKLIGGCVAAANVE